MVSYKSWVLLSSFLVGLVTVDGATFGCTTALTDDYRNTALQAHLQYRKLVATGQAPNKCGTLPTAENYYEIQWDCALEQAAFNWSSACSYAYATGLSTGQMVHMTSSTSVVAGFLKSFMTNVNKPPTSGTVDDTMSYSSPLGDWNTIVNAQALYVGCATVQCSGNYLTTCRYSKPAYSNQKVYTVGPYCVTDADCDAILDSVCNEGVCRAPPKADETINTQCPSNPAMNDYARDQVLAWHNKYRALVIKGNEPAGPDGVRRAPKGKNMYKLKYSCQLETNSQIWANNCPFGTLGHSPSSNRTGWGENMAWIPVGSVGENMAKSVQLYYSELPEYGMGDLTTNIFNSATDMSAGHYTQVVWGKTYQVGCGIKACPDGYHHLVCQYNVAGNMGGGYPVYEVATTGAGGCTSDADCTTQAADTCSTTDGLCNRA